MTKSETIWNRAKAALVLPGSRGEDDLFLWEHSARVANSALTIAAFPEAVGAATEQVALLAAALFHDAGWAVRCRSGECTRADILTRPLSAVQRETSHAYMEQTLGDVMGASLLDRAGRVIRQYTDRDTTMPEARILADAENLEEVSLVSLWPSIRRGALEGKGVQSVLDQWHRRKEYQFWTARLNDGFHFAAVRDIAVRRLSVYEQLMEQLRQQHTGADLTVLTVIPGTRNDPTMSAAKAG